MPTSKKSQNLFPKLFSPCKKHLKPFLENERNPLKEKNKKDYEKGEKMLDICETVGHTTCMNELKQKEMIMSETNPVFESKSSIDWNQVSLRQSGQIGAYRALVRGLCERLENSDDVVDQATVAFALEQMAMMEEEKIYE